MDENIESESPPGRGGSPFPQTRWSLVISTQDHESPVAERALSELCEMYWFPLYSFVRRRGHSPQDAEDLTQEFFHRVIEKNFLGSADAGRGKLRSFLLGAMKNFLSESRKAANAQKRGGGRTILSLDQRDAENRYLIEPGHDATPEALFEKHWARTLLDHIMTKLRAVYTDLGKVELFETLHEFMEWNAGDVSYSDASAKLGITENAARVSVFRMRKRFGELLREQIEETVASPDDVAGELQHVFEVLRG